MTRTEQNKVLVRRYFDALNRHDIDAAAELLASDLVNHAAVPEAQGAAGFRVIMSKLLEAFPDQQVRCEDIIAEGDRVVCRVAVTGTNTGPLSFSRFPLPATGKSVATESIHVMRLEDGKVVEHWAGRDDIGMLRQLGHLPVVEAQS